MSLFRDLLFAPLSPEAVSIVGSVFAPDLHIKRGSLHTVFARRFGAVLLTVKVQRFDEIFCIQWRAVTTQETGDRGQPLAA